MAQGHIGSKGENRGHPPCLDREGTMSSRIDPSMQLDEGPARDPPLNRTSGDPESLQLPAPHNPVLPARKVRNGPVDSDGPIGRPVRFLRAKSAFPTHGMGNALLVGHTANGPPRPRTCGARFVPTPSLGARKKGPSPPLPPLALIPSSEGGCLLRIPRDQEKSAPAPFVLGQTVRRLSYGLEPRLNRTTGALPPRPSRPIRRGRFADRP